MSSPRVPEIAGKGFAMRKMIGLQGRAREHLDELTEIYLQGHHNQNKE